ncbi:hypothetical protein B0H63DRAFT_434062 [Podospora didyma]|uniref:SET domain-containing protein n=1 Tax=Podospora didyma TaxID=330526 RepID=A0AAE0NR78_9PEZI|nr:hypothetical protein B0H63DRAFT_434062 [Podospora didyma]
MMPSKVITLSAFLCLASLILSAEEQQCGWGLLPSPLDKQQPTCVDSRGAGNNPESWAPWTHRPHCVSAEESDWCVYTNAAVPHNGHGISIITTPERAAESLSLFEHDIEFLSHPPTSRAHNVTAEKLEGPNRPFEVRDIPGKGKGAVASRRIEKGRVILVDHAAFLATDEYPADMLREEVQELLRQGIEQLRDPEKVYGLARKGSPREDDELFSAEEDLLFTNSFAVTVGEESYMALFADLAVRWVVPELTCTNSAFIHFSETTLSITVWSARDIEPGEEITITYSEAGITHAERQETLRDVWGFNCSCSLCTADNATRTLSDTRRLAIRSLRDEVLALAQKGEFETAISRAEVLFATIEAENLTAHMAGSLYEIPARLYYHVGELEKALEYATKALREADSLGVPGPKDEVRIATLREVMGRIEREMEEKRGSGGKGADS